jgi:hypothetical protein
MTGILSIVATGSTIPAAVFALLAFAGLTLLLAITGLTAFQSRSRPRLVWSSFALPAMGIPLMVTGLLAQGVLGDRPFIGELYPWVFLAVGLYLTLAGCALFAFVTWKVGAFASDIGGWLAVAAVFHGLTALTADVSSGKGWGLAVTGVTFGLCWIELGRVASRKRSAGGETSR